MNTINPSILPQVKGWKLIVLPKTVEETTAGGIVIPTQAQDANKHLSRVGQVVGMGELCYEDERFGNRKWCHVGDWVMFGQYKGDNIKVKDDTGEEVELVILNDDQVMATVEKPESIIAYV